MGTVSLRVPISALCVILAAWVAPTAWGLDNRAREGASVVVVVHKGELRALQLAAADLARYLGAMLGCQVPVQETLPEPGTAKKVFLLATPLSRPNLPEELAIQLSSDSLSSLGPDGCLAVCAPPVLLLAGNTPRGAANGVWKYLEEYCHVGFFWSGDYVPCVRRLPFSKVAFKEKPQFEERYTSPPGTYTLVEHMDWEDWQREIDWRVHKRQNMFFGPGGELVWKKVFADMDGQVYTPSAADQWQDDLYRKIARYARDRGLMLVMPGFMGDVPAEFVAAHPDVRYLGGTRWGETPMSKHVYPSDPMFYQLSMRYIYEYVARYGPAEYYFVPPYPEANPGETPEEKHSLKLDFAAVLQRIVLDYFMALPAPKVVWLADAWAFLTTDFWPPEEVRAFFDAITIADRFRIYDTWGEERPMWTLHNAFWGKPWAFGVLQCFGGNTTLHGDVHALVRDVHRVITDPAAEHCMGLYLVPEALHHNDLFFDLAMNLGWDPSQVWRKDSRVKLGPFLQDYALRRYGPRSAPRMARVLNVLAETVYACKDMTQPLYLHQLFTTFDFPNASVYAPPDQVARVPVLRRALDTALKEADRQQGNPLYERDIIDIARRYLGDLFNGIVPNVVYAWRAGDKDRFEQAARDALAVLTCTEEVLQASPQFRLDVRTEKSRARPDFAELVAQSRNVMSIWEGSANLDYARRDDLAELIRGYYKPRLEAWLERLRSVRPEAWFQTDDDLLAKTYWDLGKKWASDGVVLAPPARPVAEAVRHVLEATLELERYRPHAAEELVNCGFDRGWEGWSLSARRMSLSFEPDPQKGSGKALRFKTWPNSSGGNLYLFQTVKASSAEISLDVLLELCGESGFAGLRVEGYDEAFRRVVECTYQYGDAWNYWPDRNRPDNATPEWSPGATGFLWWRLGHYAIKHRLGKTTKGWEHLEAEPAEDVDRAHGAGTWSRLGVRTLRIALVASTRRVEDPVSGGFRRLRVKLSP